MIPPSLPPPTFTRVSSRTPSHGHARAQHRPELAQVSEHASRGDLRPRPGAPNDQRRARHLVRVPRRGYLQDVIRALEPRERVGRVELGELHAPRALLRVHLAHETQHLALRRRRRRLLGDDAVKLGKPSLVLRDVAILQLRGHQGLDVHVVESQVHAALPRRDDHLPRHVQAVEVVPRVGFRVSRTLRGEHHVAERLARPGVPRVEQEAHRPGEDALHGPDAIAGGAQRAKRGHHRKPRADGALVQPNGFALIRGGLKAPEPREVAAVGLLVRGDDVHARGEPLAVPVRDGFRGGVVHDHRGAVRAAGAREIRQFRDERVQIRGDGGVRGERPRVPFRDRAIADGGVHRVRVHAVRAGREDHVLGVRARRDAEVESAGGEQRRGVRANLLERRLADEAGADETDVEGYLRTREGAV
mmetsp:Transcript_14856/g.58238  ORF Transcript_14856/g.58238 Transcript_14856/m.58238 type:complete len:417 (+) Transcript_14856:222-1472(+)